jgi:hypothetical protein
MATAPRINFFDGSGTTTSLTITTNSTSLVFTGEVDSNTIDIQININGAGFISNPSLVDLSLPLFTVPNLSSFPNGLELEKGTNTIELRAIDLSGSYSFASTITIDLVEESDLNIIPGVPTGIRLQRNANSVQIQWSDITNSDITGYNVYASTGAGGSGSGYLRINENLIPFTSPTEATIEEIGTETVSYDIQNPDPDVLPFIPGQASQPVAEGADLIITTQIADPISGDIIEEVGRNTFPLLRFPNFRLNIDLNTIVDTNFFSFVHNRNDGIGDGILNSDTFSVVDPEDPLFYVVTAVIFYKAVGLFVESRFSQEISGAPLPLDTTVRGIRIREQDIIVRDYISEIQKAQPTLSLIPGSTVREVHIEPFSNEMQKAYFLMDFVHRAKSFAALLQIDDPNLSGTSVPVSASGYKQQLKAALALSSDAAVQALIDNSFDSLAANFGVQRLGLRPATVRQTFYTTTKPTNDIFVAQDAIVNSSTNTTAPRFVARGSVVLTASNALAFYNPDKRWYEIKVDMVADTPGSIGNLPAGEIDTIVSGADGFQTKNEEASKYGRDIQSNLELSEDASRTLYSLDTGTEGGYERTSIGTPGLIEVRIVKSGDPDMMRDYDEVRGKHIGGKVDIWVKGILERSITETFAFQFEIAQNVRFDVIDPINLIFRARDSRLDVNNPIREMLNNPAQGFGLRNQSLSPTEEYDLTGVSLVDYRTIQLNTSIPQPTTLLDDFVEGDYRYRSNNRFIASIQPIRRVTSVTGEVSGVLDAVDGFILFKVEDPLLEGESTIASDYIEINQVNGVPSGNSIAVNDEQHVMIGQFEEPLNSVGINTFTLKVYSEDRTIEYNGPDTTNPDYLVIDEGSQTRPIKIVRTTFSSIENGSTVSVDYDHDENFSVIYVINDVLQQLQERINNGIDGGKDGKHITADVLVKQAIENPLILESTVQLEPNADQGTVDSGIRTGITVLTDSRGVGGAIRQSDMVKVFEDVNGMDFVVQPFTRLTLQDGALRIRDVLPSNYDALPSLDQGSNAVYILTEPLPFDTTDGGGDDNIHHGVFMDELIMTMASSLNNVASGVNQAWIIGRNGAIIDGYSDDATLLPTFITQSAVDEERLRLTANKIVVALNAGIVPIDTPDNHAFAVSYVVNGDVGTEDIETSQIEFLTPGSVTITYRSA